MKPEEFYEREKRKSAIENEYFIAMDKQEFFQMMEDYAVHRIEHQKHLDMQLSVDADRSAGIEKLA